MRYLKPQIIYMRSLTIYCSAYLFISPSLISATASMKRPEDFVGGTEPICRFSSHFLNPPRNESCRRSTDEDELTECKSYLQISSMSSIPAQFRVHKLHNLQNHHMITFHE